MINNICLAGLRHWSILHSLLPTFSSDLATSSTKGGYRRSPHKSRRRRRPRRLILSPHQITQAHDLSHRAPIFRISSFDKTSPGRAKKLPPYICPILLVRLCDDQRRNSTARSGASVFSLNATTTAFLPLDKYGIILIFLSSKSFTIPEYAVLKCR
ncbi:hypothetical protein GWI33_009310 [Rhynchophorus ferrugineus]|uniref:Uncharacterized protein n=1 Tax=Rhynchophorus ferrugineus TaxID=354439 RepID=A0A834IDI4_RHYFE|nr:hypothetical protein GWI33_009310 [Rhynchophorus ferrugineus]